MERQRYYGHPEAKEGPFTPFKPVPGANPVLRGIPLAIAGSAAANIGLIPNILWGNAGFNALRKLKLDEYEPRYDPTVIPVHKDSTIRPDAFNAIDPSISASPRTANPYRTVGDYHAAYVAGLLTPTTAAKTLLDLISHTPQHRVAFLDIERDQVLAAAEESTRRYKAGDARGQFDGVPVAVKDEVELHGHTRCFGSSQDFTSSKDVTSWCVQKWENAGAIILGKLNMHELGLDTTNNNPTKGTPVNPHNPHYYTGGSSGGSAYAVSAGLFPVTLGADGGGSIRIPAAFCGLYGLKPSHGRISGSPTTSLAPSCGVLGPIASSMKDLELAYRIMAAPNPDDCTSSAFPSPSLNSERKTMQKVIGLYKPYFDFADSNVLKSCHAALSYFEGLGYRIIDIQIPYLPEGQLAHAMTILSEISSSVTDLSNLSPANKVLISVGKKTPASDFLLAQKMRNLLMQHLAFLFEEHPSLLIVTPTTPTAGWHIDGGAADLKHGVSDANMSVKNMIYVWLANFCGCPAITIPVGRTTAKEGDGKIPVGLMAMAEWGKEEDLLEWGRAGEKWAWKEGEEQMEKPGNWVDVIELAKQG